MIPHRVSPPPNSFFLQRLSELELEKVDHQKGIGLKDKELDEARLLIQQHEAKMRSMLESIKELEEIKSVLSNKPKTH